MKKLLNSPGDVVAEALLGMAAAHADRWRVDHRARIVVRRDAPLPGKVGLVAGGGSGHEPLHTGYVGRGMLDAACLGEIFTSPVPDQVLAAAHAVDSGAGVLFIVKNYTGDVMNFEMGAEMARAQGIDVEMVVVDDDVAVRDSSATAGRRGVGLTVLLEKVVGAAAEQGWGLADLAGLARRVNARGRSMGLALTSCTVPAVGRPTFELGENQVELGVGIHGEAGRARLPLAPARELARMLVEPVLADLEPSGPVVCLLNGMGATPLLELYLVHGEVEDQLAARGVRVVRRLVGNHVTSLDMAGCSLTLLEADDQLLTLWDAPVDTPGLGWGG